MTESSLGAFSVIVVFGMLGVVALLSCVCVVFIIVRAIIVSRHSSNIEEFKDKFFDTGD